MSSYAWHGTIPDHPYEWHVAWWDNCAATRIWWGFEWEAWKWRANLNFKICAKKRRLEFRPPRLSTPSLCKPHFISVFSAHPTPSVSLAPLLWSFRWNGSWSSLDHRHEHFILESNSLVFHCILFQLIEEMWSCGVPVRGLWRRSSLGGFGIEDDLLDSRCVISCSCGPEIYDLAFSIRNSRSLSILIVSSCTNVAWHNPLKWVFVLIPSVILRYFRIWNREWALNPK